MRGPKPAALSLTPRERADLEELVRRHSAPQQLVLRARVVLAAADGMNNAQIAGVVERPVVFARRWRTRWLALAAISLADLAVEARLTDLPRLGRPIQITAAQVCQIVRIGCEAPSDSNRPITEWSGREIADEAIRRQIVPQISARHAARLLKRGISNRIVSDHG